MRHDAQRGVREAPFRGPREEAGRIPTNTLFTPEQMAQDDAPDWYCAEVLTGRTRVRKLVETPLVLGFVPPKPSFFPEHIIVIPKRHVPSLFQLDDSELTLDLVSVIKQLAQDITARHNGCQVFTNLGDYQGNKHLHWHLACGEGISSFPGSAQASFPTDRTK